MANEKKDRIRLTVDLSLKEMSQLEKLQEIFDVPSHAEVIRSLIRENLVLSLYVEQGDKIQRLKKDGTVETIVFTNWMPFYCGAKKTKEPLS